MVNRAIVSINEDGRRGDRESRDACSAAEVSRMLSAARPASYHRHMAAQCSLEEDVIIDTVTSICPY